MVRRTQRKGAFKKSTKKSGISTFKSHSKGSIRARKTGGNRKRTRSTNMLNR